MATICARDDFGNVWHKKVAFVTGHDGEPAIDLGWPNVYSARDIIAGRHRKGRFCIDLAGRNHKGHPVYVDHAELVQLAEQAMRAADPEAKIPHPFDIMTEPQLEVFLRDLAETIKDRLPPGTGFMLHAAPAGSGVAQYIGNVDRECAAEWMRENIARWEAGDDIPRGGG